MKMFGFISRCVAGFVLCGIMFTSNRHKGQRRGRIVRIFSYLIRRIPSWAKNVIFAGKSRSPAIWSAIPILRPTVVSTRICSRFVTSLLLGKCLLLVCARVVCVAVWLSSLRRARALPNLICKAPFGAFFIGSIPSYF